MSGERQSDPNKSSPLDPPLPPTPSLSAYMLSFPTLPFSPSPFLLFFLILLSHPPYSPAIISHPPLHITLHSRDSDPQVQRSAGMALVKMSCTIAQGKEKGMKEMKERKGSEREEREKERERERESCHSSHDEFNVHSPCLPPAPCLLPPTTFLHPAASLSTM